MPMRVSLLPLAFMPRFVGKAGNSVFAIAPFSLSQSVPRERSPKLARYRRVRCALPPS